MLGFIASVALRVRFSLSCPDLNFLHVSLSPTRPLRGSLDQLGRSLVAPYTGHPDRAPLCLPRRTTACPLAPSHLARRRCALHRRPPRAPSPAALARNALAASTAAAGPLVLAGRVVGPRRAHPNPAARYRRRRLPGLLTIPHAAATDSLTPAARPGCSHRPGGHIPAEAQAVRDLRGGKHGCGLGPTLGGM